MRKINTKLIEDKVYKAALEAGINLTPACREALFRAYEAEKSEAAKFALKTLIDNSDVAVNEGMPVCQDTGMAIVII